MQDFAMGMLSASLGWFFGTMIFWHGIHANEKPVFVPDDANQVCVVTPAKNGQGGGYDCKDI